MNLLRLENVLGAFGPSFFAGPGLLTCLSLEKRQIPVLQSSSFRYSTQESRDFEVFQIQFERGRAQDTSPYRTKYLFLSKCPLEELIKDFQDWVGSFS